MNGNTTGNSSLTASPAPAQSGPQSWFDLVVMPTMDPRAIISTVSFEDSTGTMRLGIFERSGAWLSTGPWGNTPLSVSVGTGTTLANVTVPNTYDYASIQAANTWNSTHLMTPVSPVTLPPAVQQIMFGKAGAAFVNNYYFDWKAGVTSSNVLMSLRDNSVTSGDFQNGANGTVPLFAFPATATYGNTGRNLQITFLRPGRFHLAMVIVDSTSTTSMIEMEFIVLP